MKMTRVQLVNARRWGGRQSLALLALLMFAAGCAGGGSTPPAQTGSTPPAPTGRYPIGTTVVPLTTIDNIAGGPCSVSVDGSVWYTLPNGLFPAINFTRISCEAAASSDAQVIPRIPAWARPSAPTQAIFIATSLQEAYSLVGMQAIERLANSAGIPVSWMVGNSEYLSQNAAYYNTLHSQNGDDVELEQNASLYSLAKATLPWYAPAVSIAGAGHERNVAQALALGNGAFWGITWNSHGTDNTSDMGAPWGTYCADVSSYKRPSPTGDCTLASFEWTARDLTRAYLANTNAQGYSAEAAFSTDPDDVLLRAGFDTNAGAAYVRSLVDAYAAAGVSQPLVMMSQQESAEEGATGTTDDVVLGALYRQAVADGMKPMTLRDALPLVKTFSVNPRAIAFPYIPGGQTTEYNGVPFTPATIDYHDNVAGMTFVSGHTLPFRVFPYADDLTSMFNRTLVEVDPTNPNFPTLTATKLVNGTLSFSFSAQMATHIGIALWADPARLFLSGANVVPAGHAGAVVTFDIPAGTSTQTVRCGGCTSTTFTYSS